MTKNIILFIKLTLHHHHHHDDVYNLLGIGYKFLFFQVINIDIALSCKIYIQTFDIIAYDNAHQ